MAVVVVRRNLAASDESSKTPVGRNLDARDRPDAAAHFGEGVGAEWSRVHHRHEPHLTVPVHIQIDFAEFALCAIELLGADEVEGPVPRGDATVLALWKEAYEGPLTSLVSIGLIPQAATQGTEQSSVSPVPPDPVEIRVKVGGAPSRHKNRSLLVS